MDDDSARTLLDINGNLHQRLKALGALVESDPRSAMPVLLQVGERVDEPVVLLKEVGSALASLSYQGIPLTEFDMRDLNAITYEAFSEWMPPG